MTDNLDVREMDIPGGAMLYDAQRVARPVPSLFDPKAGGAGAHNVAHGGRQAAWFIQGKFGRAVLRHYRRGGLVAKLSADRYIWSGAKSTRSFSEFELLRSMYIDGLPVPRPLAAAYWRKGPTYRAAILIERLEGVEPLARIFHEGHQTAVAEAIFAMHEAGVWHADLNAYNILLDPEGKAWLIDFDKGSRQVLSLERRHANLLRLRRSLVKVAESRGLQWWTELSHAYGLLARAKGHL